MRLSDFDYNLPAERIAQQPPAERDGARMLWLHRSSDALEDRWFRELPDLLDGGDLLVVNDSKVLPARLYGTRLGLHAQARPSPRNPAAAGFLKGEVEVLLLSEIEPGVWDALVHPGRRLQPGERLVFNVQGEPPGTDTPPRLEAEIVGRGPRGQRRLHFHYQGDFHAHLAQLGHVPLPPYIRRPDGAEDRDRYQTIFAGAAGAAGSGAGAGESANTDPGSSAAAPTAGLHFSSAILERLSARGIGCVAVTLAIGLATFQPIYVDDVTRHVMHPERFAVSAATAEALNRTRRNGGRIVAVGTTAARTLESIAPASGASFRPVSGETRLFLYPGQPFRVVDALLTNFHAPRTSLLLMVSAFAGAESIRRAYRHALDGGYRFLSYGDCMLIV